MWPMLAGALYQHKIRYDINNLWDIIMGYYYAYNIWDTCAIYVYVHVAYVDDDTFAAVLTLTLTHLLQVST